MLSSSSSAKLLGGLVFVVGESELSSTADSHSLSGDATALVGVHSGPKMLLLDGNLFSGKSVFTESDGGSDRRTVTIESWPGKVRSVIGDLVVVDPVLGVLGEATGVA